VKGCPLTPEGEEEAWTRYSPNTGQPVDNLGVPLPIDPETLEVMNTITQKPFGQKFNPQSCHKIDAETLQEDACPYNRFTGLPQDLITNTPYGVDERNGTPVNPRTGHEAPGSFSPETGKPMNFETGETIPARFDPQSGRPVNPKTGELVPIDEKTGQPTDETGKVYPGHYDPKSSKPVDPKTKKPLKEPKVATPQEQKKWVPERVKNHPQYDENKPVDSQAWLGNRGPNPPPERPPYGDRATQPIAPDQEEKPGPLPKQPKFIPPDEINRRPGGRYDPALGLPLDPESGNSYPIDDKLKQPYNPATDEPLPGLFDPETLQPLNPQTKEAYPDEFDRFTGIPINPETKKPAEINPQTGLVIHPGSGITLQDKWDPISGRIIDPETNAPVPANFDSKTGRPINPVTGQLYPIDPETFRPYDEDTGKEFPGFFSPQSGFPIDPQTNEEFCDYIFDENTGRPLDPKSKEVLPIDSLTATPYNPETGQILPMLFNPKTGRKVDDRTLEDATDRYDACTGLPIDPVSEEKYKVDPETHRPFNPRTEHVAPGHFDTSTGRPLDPVSNKPIPDRFDPHSGRPID